MAHYTITKMSQSHIREVLNISGLQLGKGYLAEKDILPYLENTNKTGMVATDGHKVLGFSTLRLCTRNEISKITRLSSEMIDELFFHHDTIGYRAQTVVHPDHLKRGIGNSLVEKGNKWLAERTDRIISIAWFRHETVIGPILVRHGLKRHRELPQYWYRDSLEKGFTCPLCGNPPCTCHAYLYVK